MSILAGATQSSQGDSSLIAGIHNEDLSFAFASQEEIESEIQDSTLGLTLKRDRDEAFGGEDGTDVKKKFKRTGTWCRIDSIEETEDLVGMNQLDYKYEYDPKLRPYTAIVYKNQYTISMDTGRESNRVFRTVPANRFLILTLPPINNMREVLNILNRDITHTVPETGEIKRFTFLSSSDSRIRTRDRKTVLFFEEGPDHTARSLLQNFGDLDAVLLKSGIGKYFARLSLNFSTTVPTINIPRSQVATIPDLQAPDGKKFTDGCGCITTSAARRVAKALGLKYIPSVFQFRYAGAKGVLVPQEAADLEKWFPRHYEPGIVLYLRPSQIKYEAWEYTSLDISDYSRQRTVFKCAKLQRAMIRLLTDHGVPLRNFKVLLRKELEHLTGVLKDRQKASDWLKRQETSLDAGERSPQALCLRMIAAGHDLAEPYLAQMLGRMLSKDILTLRRKLHIPVANSLYLFGVCDESGTLSEDQIYCHAGTDGFIEGKVLVTRSPMMHPGDIRLVTAIKPAEDNPYYRQSDCVVLPVGGYQPLADKMGGGDLDGDQYFISWNEAIIPETVDSANPREVSRPGTPLEGKIKFDPQVDKKIKDHMGNLKRYVSKRVLSFDIGATAKTWEEAANALQLGSRDPYCLALSARYECCLDTNKTGEEIPPIPSNTLKGFLRTGPCPFEQLDLIIRQETLGLSNPWTYGKGDRTSEEQHLRFQRDPDLMFEQHTPAWRKAYADVCRLLSEYWTEFHKNLHEMEGPNRPLVRLEKEPEPVGRNEPTTTAKDLAREAFQDKMEQFMDSQRWTLFNPAHKGAEHNHENTIIASACYSAVYDRMSNGLSTPIEMGWWGEPWLNNLKAQRINESLGSFGPPVCVARSSNKRDFQMELSVREMRRVPISTGGRTESATYVTSSAPS